MLQQMRDNARNSLALLLLGLLILAFAVWGIDFQFGGNQSIVQVDGEEIPQNTIVNAYNQQLQRYMQVYPNGIPPIQQEELKQSVLEAFVRNELLTQHTIKQGYQLSDEAVMAEIKSTPGFQIDGKFDIAQFEFAASRSGLSPDGLFNEFRKTMLMQQLAQSFNDTAFVTEDEIRQRGQLQREKREIRLLNIEVNKLLADIVVEDSAIEYEYELNKADYMTDEMIRLDYIELDPAKISESMEVDEAAIQTRYEAGVEGDEFSSEETRNSRHILLSVNGDRDEATALSEITALRERALAGEDFAELAKQYSDDAGSKPQGGDLGWSTGETFVEPFRDALMALTGNEISAPVKTRFGYHIIKLEGVRGREVKPLAEVREQLEKEYLEDKALDELSNLVNIVDDAVYDVDDSLEAAALAAGVEVQQTGWFSRLGGTGVANNPAVREIAFSEQVLNDRLNSSSIEIDDKYVYIRINDHRPSRVMTLEEVKPRIENQLKRRQASELAMTKGSEALAKLKAGESFDALAEAMELTISEAKTIERTERSISADAVRAIFSAPKPGETAGYGGIATNTGDYVLFEINGVTPGAPLDKTQVADFARATANMEFAAYLSSLRDQAKVVVRPDLLTQ